MDETFDYIIVGAGSAGCAIAARLTEDTATRVLLLEAGGEDDDWYVHMPLGFLKTIFDPKLSWGYMGEPEPQLGGRPMWLPRGKLLGGSSSINGLFYMRGHPNDYDTWAQMGARGWSYADVLPYFRRMEDSWRGESEYHGTGGPVSVVPNDGKWLLHDPLRRATVMAGYPESEDLGGAQAEGAALGELTVDKHGRRASAASAYLREARKRPNLEVRTHALSRRITFDGKRATGIEYERGGESHTALAAKEVIVSAGAYNSPQLLMLSGIGDPRQLADLGIAVHTSLPGVGRNLAEHPNVMLEFAATRPVTFLNQLRFDRAVRNVLQWKLFGTGPFSRQVNSCNIVIRTRRELAQPDVQLMANPVAMDAKVWFPGIGARPRHKFACGVVLLNPRSRGWVKLRSADPHAPVAVTQNFMDSAEDYATMRRGIAEARRIYRTGPQGELTGAELTPGEDVASDAALDAWIRDSVVCGQHSTGTCAMGVGSNAVVDADLRVIGVDGLRVADASVMPTIVGANTNATAIMIGEKAADLIRGRTLAPAEV